MVDFLPIDRLICAEPLNHNILETDKVLILSERTKLLKKVKPSLMKILTP